MEYLGITKNIDNFFEKQECQNVYCYTEPDDIAVRIGFQFKENIHVLKMIAIQMGNSTNEIFELFKEDDMTFKTEKEMKDYSRKMAELFIQYKRAKCTKENIL